ncbi:DedA family protein [Serratia microhaemolytica]|uniref:DedA family protein n=1 Tax=Serratia microhaemolytica TaxID=2675110 RepID=UPI000FDEA43C|nr:DedA family protein [Serratia microhaemolytica]
MEIYLQQLVTQSLAFTLVIVMLLVFIESLALVGLLLPGTVIMASLGALIGSRQVDFYMAWIGGIFGGLLGDWLSYFIGRAFKKPLHRWPLLKKNQRMMDKISHALYQHSFIAVLLGRFIGPTRPLVPMVAGMMYLPAYRFAPPNIIACLAWPPVYFFPGILAGVAIDIPTTDNGVSFKWLLFTAIILIWLTLWLSWRWWREDKRGSDKLTRWLSPLKLRLLSLLSWLALLICLYHLFQHPLMPVFLRLLWNVLAG